MDKNPPGEMLERDDYKSLFSYLDLNSIFKR